MIERQFISQKLKEKQVQDYLHSQLRKTGYSHTEIKRTPLGEKIIVYTTHPGIVVGRKGENIQKLTATLKKRFKMENPQIEIAEIENPMLDVAYVCDRIVSVLERLGSQRFKSVGYKTLQGIMDAGAMGAEIIISGKVPSARARSWRFSAGYLKKSGDASENYVKRAYDYAKLKPGVIGIRVSIMPPDLILGDRIDIKEKIEQEQIKEKPEAEKNEKPVQEEEKEKKKEKKSTKSKKETTEVPEKKEILIEKIQQETENGNTPEK